MAKAPYKKQVELLLTVLPEVAKEDCFALHGGTAINLFVRDMPRLSVDIDLTYVPIQDRATSFTNIGNALLRIKATIEKVFTQARITHRKEEGKLLISVNGIDVKLEVSMVGRGTLTAPVGMILCNNAQEEFEAFCAINVVPAGQLYGGKICAALDRQHPRDLFDVKYLLENEGYTKEVKEGFYFRLLSAERPINEVLFPNLLDQRAAMENQFTGMSKEDFSYAEFERVRDLLLNEVHKNLTEEDKQFILDFKEGTPNWALYNFEQFPAIIWKLQNIQRLKEINANKHRQLYAVLEGKLKNM